MPELLISRAQKCAEPHASSSTVAAERRAKKRSSWAWLNPCRLATRPGRSETAGSNTFFARSTAMVVLLATDSSFPGSMRHMTPTTLAPQMPFKSREESISSFHPTRPMRCAVRRNGEARD